MQVKRFIGSVLLSAGLLAGCGGIEADVEEQSSLESRKDELPSCNNMAFERVFYSEPEKINVVGGWLCECGWSNPGRWGALTGYFTDFNESYCESNP
ncbi:hypothetical protein HPC49_49095 [Pyxidicoccus fallax]|uniref:Lipoprotein n=1 Tax=Pyxidicoccus fallax TaxID=394095 RepID=A0A848M1J4_9BACT|nr:hypothetical protein [Pyxidicoccus fallax]NMO23234.1 hypothetical protein [Pyxidicoccus fallax]NPC86131.1 hypothetical protein [Pyxidicoccus fallax]